MDHNKMTPYESKALEEIHIWKNPELGWWDYAMNNANWPLDKIGDAVMATPGVGWVIQKSASGLVTVANDVAQYSVRPEAIFDEYRSIGCSVRKHADVLDLDLSQVDKAIGYLGGKYKGIALVEGAAGGFAGLPGIPPDIIALVTLNLRAIGEYGTYCGFDMTSQAERLFAMNVLALASSPNDAAKALAMAQLAKIAKDVAMKKVWRDLEKHALVKIFQQIAKAVGIRVTKAKLAQVIPIAGAVVGAGFNAYFTAKVCDAAYFLYRERFLAWKYGDEGMVEVTGPPPDTLDPGYLEKGIELSDEPPPELPDGSSHS